MEHAGFVDAAWELFGKTGDAGLLARTASDDRVDQVPVSWPLAGAIVSYRLLDTPVGASDHKSLVVEIDTDKIDTENPWDYR